jgi:hypothetical protein
MEHPAEFYNRLFTSKDNYEKYLEDLDSSGQAFQFRLQIINRAIEEEYVIELCKNCRIGTVIRSKEKSFSKCLRCLHITRTQGTAKVMKRVRCDQCKRFFMAVLATKYCTTCSKSIKEHGKL